MASYKDSINLIEEHIKSGEFSRVYLLGGDEKYLLRQYKDKLIDALCDRTDSMNYVAYKGEEAKPSVIADFALTMPFFADRRVVVVENSDFFKKGNEEIEELLNTLPETTVLIFIENNIDKRCKIYKTTAKLGSCVEFTSPDEKTLLVWIKSLFKQNEISISDEAVIRLHASVGSDMNTLAMEVEKLICYAYDTKEVSVLDVENLCVSQIEDKIFDMMDSLAKRDKKTTLDLYNDLIALKEAPMKILVLITRQFNILLKLKLALENNTEYSKLASLVKIPSFFVKKYQAQADAYTYSQLLDRVNKCQEVDSQIKRGSRRDAVAVEMLIINLLLD